MKKKQYVKPLCEVTKVDLMLLKITGPASIISGPSSAPLFIP